MKKRILVFTVLMSVLCVNISLANLVANGTFDLPDVSGTGGWNTGPIDEWNTTSAGHPFGAGAGLVLHNTDDPAPMSGQVAWFQLNAPRMYQTFVGTKLLPNRIYIITIDGYAAIDPSTKTIDATIIHATDSGINSTFHSLLDINDITGVVVSNGTFISNVAWLTARFNMAPNPADNAASVYHSFQFTTPATLTDPNVGIDIGIQIGHKWLESGQVKIDNVSVEVVPEPAAIGLLSLLGLAFLRRK